MTNDPLRPDHAAPEISFDANTLAVAEGPDVILTDAGTTTKFNIFALLAVVVPGLTAVVQQGGDLGLIMQGFGGLLGSLVVYLAGYNTVWYRSPKMYALLLAAALNTAGPFVTNGLVDGRWALTGQQSALAALAVFGAVIAVVVPAKEGQDQRPIKRAIAELYPDGSQSHDVSTLPRS